MSSIIEGGGIDAIGSIAKLENSEQMPTLDELSADAIRAEQIKSEMKDGGEKVLAVATEFQFKTDTSAQSEASDANSKLGPSNDINKHASELTGREASGAADDRMQATGELVRDLYLASAKTLVAWKVLDGVGKDTKVMLQAQ